jgi:hypothetical protein
MQFPTSRCGLAVLRLTALTLLAAVAGCDRQDPPSGVAQTQSAADRANRAGADGSGDGPTALSPADKARAAAASASGAASTVTSAEVPGTRAASTAVPKSPQGSPNSKASVGMQ